MARKFYRMVTGAKEHPETYTERIEAGDEGVRVPTGAHPDYDRELLYPGDVFKVEEHLVRRPAALGGWMDLKRDGVYVLDCAVEVDEPKAQRETRTTRDEPSKLIGINISEQEYARVEAGLEAQSSSIQPRMPVGKRAPASVAQKAPAAPTGPVRVKR